jgi:zinc protease
MAIPYVATRCLVLLAAVLCLANGIAVAATPSQAAEHRLPNGLRIIVKPDHRAPVAVVMVWYRVGSVDEHNGTTGVAHVLEHMMFKGTKTMGAGEYSRIIAGAGGRDNAFTSRDYTGYFATLHKSHLPLALKLEADRMTNLNLSREEFEKEIRVVMEERRLRTEDQPRSRVFEELAATALKAHPYRQPIIGWMNDLENMKVEDAQAFYDRWYAPNNAIVVVVGDVTPAEVYTLVEEHFGSKPRKALPDRKPQQEPPQLGVRRVTVKAPAELPYVMMAFSAPALRKPEEDWEPYALEMLANVLDGNDAARLNSTLVRKERIASSADASYDGIARGPGMFYLSATPSAGKSVQDVEQALRREVARVVKDGVSEDELKRVRAQAIAAHVYQRDSMFYQARQIGSMEMAGLSYRVIDLILEKLKVVTAEQVQAVARKYLVDDSLTVAYLDPQPLGNKAPATPAEGAKDVR